MVAFSLKTKMSIAVSLLVVALMAGSAFLVISHFHERFTANVGAQQYALLTEMTQDIDDFINDTRQTIVLAANSFPRYAIDNPVLARGKLAESAALHTLFDNGIFLVSPSGTVIAEYPELPDGGTDFLQREYFQKTVETAKPQISEPYISSQPHHHPAVVFSAPIFGNSGKVVAVLAGSIDLTKDNFLGEHARVRIGTTGYTYVFSTDRTIIMHPDLRRTLKRDEPPGVNRAFDKAIAGFDGTEETANADGLRTLTSVKHLQSINWILAANYPLSEAYAPVREATRYAIVAAVAGGILSVLVVWLVMKAFTAPLLALTRHISELPESGTAERNIRIRTHDEIAELAIAFNDMIRRLDSKQEELHKLSHAVEQSASLVVITDTNGAITYVNPKFCELTGYSAAEVIGGNPHILKSGKLPPEAYRNLWETITAGYEWQGEFHNQKKNGELFWTVASISPIKNDRGEITHFISVQEDITERKRTEELVREVLRQQQAILDNIPDVAWLKDPESRFVAVNNAFAAWCGMRPEELTGKTDYDISPPEAAARYQADDREVMNSGVRKYIEEPLIDNAGKILFVETIKTPIFNDRGEVIGTTGIARDITARREAEVQLRHVSTHDMLTGLYNRAFFDEELGRLARSRQFPASIIMADVDGLKAVNDSRGHEAGDRLLMAAARIFRDAFRAEDMVARIGGDEFAVLLPETEEEAAAEAVARIRKCQDAANAAGGGSVVSISLGAATARGEEELRDALRLSDERMYADKFARKGTPAAGTALLPRREVIEN